MQVASVEKRPAKKAALERLLADALKTCLLLPSVESALSERRRATAALAQTWLVYISALQVSIFKPYPSWTLWPSLFCLQEYCWFGVLGSKGRGATQKHNHLKYISFV